MGGFPGDTGTCRIAWKAGMTGMSGMSGMPLEGLVTHTDGFLEDLLAFYA